MFEGVAFRAGVMSLLGLGLIQLSAAPAAGQSKQTASREGVEDDAFYIEAPPFPGIDFGRALRFQAKSRFMPNAGLGPGHVDLYAPELRGRLALPINGRAIVQVNARAGVNHYRFSGATPFKSLDDHLDLYQARLSVDGAYQLTAEDEYWLVEGEAWSLLGSLFLQSDWEGSRFENGFGGGTAIGLGYRLPDRFRLAAGALIRTDLADGGVDVGPFASFLWSITDALTLRDRGLGLLLEYRLSRKIELFASAFRTTESFSLKDRFGQDDLTFRDRQVLAGIGMEWRISKSFRLNLEAGGVVARKLRVHSGDLGTLFSQRADPTPYFDLRFELRPRRR